METAFGAVLTPPPLSTGPADPMAKRPERRRALRPQQPVAMNRRTVGWFAASRACSVDTAIMRDASAAEPPVAAPALPGDELVAARPHAANDTVRQMRTALA